jgi:hypothetical protein
MKELLLLIVWLSFAKLAFPQFTDTTNHFISYASTGVINKTNNGSSYVFSNTLRFAVRKKKTSLNSTSSWVYGWQQQRLTNNDLSTSLDFNLFGMWPRFYYWGLAAYDESYSLKVNSRLQAGIGVAYSFVDRETAFFNISNGILYEAGNLTINDSTKKEYGILRNSLRIRHRFVVSKMIVLDGTHFWQPSFYDGKDYILKSNIALSVKLGKWLSISTAANYNKVNSTKRETLLISFGLTAEKYF